MSGAMVKGIIPFKKPGRFPKKTSRPHGQGGVASSLMEGLEQTLTLHRLGMFKKLETSFKTTNCIENLNRQLGIYTGRVSHWRSSDQRRRGVATALLEIEPAMRKVEGYKYMKELRSAMRRMSATAVEKSQAA